MSPHIYSTVRWSELYELSMAVAYLSGPTEIQWIWSNFCLKNSRCVCVHVCRSLSVINCECVVVRDCKDYTAAIETRKYSSGVSSKHRAASNWIWVTVSDWLMCLCERDWMIISVSAYELLGPVVSWSLSSYEASGHKHLIRRWW